MPARLFTLVAASLGLFLLPFIASAQSIPPGNGNIPFDDNWHFLRGPATDAQKPAFDDSAWRTVNLPHDWSIENLPARDNDPLFLTILLLPGTWIFSASDNPANSDANAKDADWKEISLPTTTSPPATAKPGSSIWYRRHFTIPPQAKDKTVLLDLGVIHARDKIYVDGQKIHESGQGYWSNASITARTLELPTALATPGDHAIAVRVEGGPEAFTGTLNPPSKPSPLDPGRSAGGISTGYAVGGTGWYRKNFTLPPEDAAKQVRLVFDGSYMETSVWLNGVAIGHNVYGYSPFGIDLTPHLNPPGTENVLAVQVDNIGANSRWYSGSGIYRPVHLEVAGAARVSLWGVAITTPEVTADKATVQVHVGLDQPADVQLRILDTAGNEVAKATEQSLPNTSSRAADFSITIPHPALWSPETPTLYRADVTALVNGQPSDTRSSNFGIRTLSWNSSQGLLLNGASIKLRGGCIHHDFGALGSASFPLAEERRVATLKAAGYNAIRCSHNMPSTAFLEACDRLGMLVIDEAFDMWTIPKNPMDYSRFFKEWSQRDIEAMVHRDRNHPCIVMWSIGNEIPERFGSDGVATAGRLAGLIRAIDTTRPVTAAFNDASDGADPFFAKLDICGYNYKPELFEPDHARVPARVMFTTESYPKDSVAYWSQVEKHPYVIGDFIWTAWDYRGESAIGHTVPAGEKSSYLLGWPYENAFCGDFDTCGFVKPQSLYRQVLWDVRKVSILVDSLAPGATSKPDLWGWRDELPSWTWPGTEGKPRTVRVYAKGDQVRLLLDGKEIGTQPIDDHYTASFTLPYAPGTLTAQVLKGGATIAEDKLSTAGSPVALKLSTESTSLPAQSESVAFITVEAVDAQGTTCPLADEPVTVALNGAGTLAGFGNADPQNIDGVQSTTQHLWRGKALLIVRSNGTPGDLTASASGQGLTFNEVTIHFN